MEGAETSAPVMVMAIGMKAMKAGVDGQGGQLVHSLGFKPSQLSPGV